MWSCANVCKGCVYTYIVAPKVLPAMTQSSHQLDVSTQHFLGHAGLRQNTMAGRGKQWRTVKSEKPFSRKAIQGLTFWLTHQSSPKREDELTKQSKHLHRFWHAALQCLPHWTALGWPATAGTTSERYEMTWNAKKMQISLHRLRKEFSRDKASKIYLSIRSTNMILDNQCSHGLSSIHAPMDSDFNSH